MYIIEVIPLTILPPQVPQLLSYFFTRALLKGCVVEAVIGNRKVPAVVVSSSSLEQHKASLKKSAFQLKKLSNVIEESPQVSDIQLKTALWLSRTYFAPLGLCLKTVLPNFFGKKKYKLEIIEKDIKKEFFVPSVVISPAKRSIDNIRAEIKKTTDSNKQVLIVVPEMSLTKYFNDVLAEHYKTGIVHGKVGLKELYKIWGKISSGDIEIIIGTRQSLFLPFNNLGLVIVEDPFNEAYKSDMSPRYHTSDLAQKISGIYSCPIMFLSQIPDVKSYQLIKNGNYKITDNKGLPEVNVKIVDMVQEIKSGNFSILSRDLAEKISYYTKKKKKVLIFSTRKGYSGAFLCENCRSNIKCPNCSIPLRFYKTGEPFLKCHRCLTIQKVPQICPNCQGYKLKAVGFGGSQKIEEEIKRLLEKNGVKINIFSLDLSTIKTTKGEDQIIEKIEESGSCICIATQMIFSHRYLHKFDLIAVPNIDSLITMPDFKSEEELFHQLNKLLDFEPEEVILQTYHPENPLLSLLVKNDYKSFYEKELPAREVFWYPPFARLVKLSFRHTDRNKARYEAGILNEKLKMAIDQRKLNQSVKVLGPSPAFVEKEKSYYIYNVILKLLPNQKLEEILRFVPSNWTIDADPKSIL